MGNMGVAMMQDSLFISNFKRYGKRIVSIMLLFGVLACCCVKYYKWAENPRRALYDFYRFVEKDTIDVLCIGSSHVYCGINPVQMYDDYGIAAYNLASGSQALWYVLLVIAKIHLKCFLLLPSLMRTIYLRLVSC